MKTPMQEILKLESDLTYMFDSGERVAMALLEHIRNNKKEMLEKEKEVIETAFLEGRILRPLDSEQWYNETFNTEEK